MDISNTPAAGQPSPADDPLAALVASLTGTGADLVGIVGQITGPDPEPAAQTARALTRLAEEIAEAAVMARCLPGRPREASGHTYAATEAIVTAVAAERDVACWLGAVLGRVACRVGSADKITAGRPGSWEAHALDQLVQGVTGFGAAGSDLSPWREAR